MNLEKGFIVEERYSEWQKKKVRTILVNAFSKNPAQRSIAAALKLASENDRIELSGGEYPEAVSLNFPIELVGSEGETPRLTSRNSCITVTGNTSVYLENLELVCKSSGRIDAGVVLMGGTTTIVHCQLTSAIIGASAIGLITDCKIMNSSGGYGLVIQDAGGARVKSTMISSHDRACVDIDTRGEVRIEQCSMFNESITKGDALVISGLSSTTPGGGGNLRSSGVTVMKCTMYISMREPPSELFVNNAVGVPCCAVITQGAEPTLQENEFLEGEIGLLLDSAGPAQLHGNIIRCQRRCGFLALVEEGLAHGPTSATRIAGHNVLDRCFIGIDVRSRSNVKETFASGGVDKKRFSGEFPNPKRMFNWLAPDLVPTGIRERKEGDDKSFMWRNQLYSVHQLRTQLQGLVECTLEAYPTCLQTVFAMSAGSNTTTDAGVRRGNVFAELLNSTLGTTLASERKEASFQRMEQRRGNRGVDIVETKFLNCGLCAIRFGKYGYGLVEQCTFEECGAHALIVECGAHPLITGCRFMRSKGASLCLHTAAHPLIIGNEITSGHVSGIEASDGSQGIIVGNMITNQRGNGVLIGGNSSTLVCGNYFLQNKEGGMTVSNASTPCVMFNCFTGNSGAQLKSTTSAHPYIAFNEFQAAAGAAMIFSECSRGIVYKNVIDHNQDGIVIEMDADPIVENNHIRDNWAVGLLARDNGLGTIVDNIIENSSGPNVLSIEGASPSIRKNIIRKGIQGGIVVAQEGCGTFEHNRVEENSVSNVIIADAHTNPTIKRNVICMSSSGCGVVCCTGAEGQLTHNSIFENRQCGVYILSKANPNFISNTISREAVGVLCSNGGKGHFVENTIDRCYSNGVLSQQEGEPWFERNIIKQSRMSGLLISSDGMGKFEENEFYENDIGVQLGSSLPSASLDITSVYISTKDPFPVLQRKVSTMTGAPSSLLNRTAMTEQRRQTQIRLISCHILSNKVHTNTSGGVLIDGRCSGTMENNDVYNNNGYGIRGDSLYSRKRAESILNEKVMPSSSSRGGVVFQDDEVDGRVVLKGNKVHQHKIANVHFIELNECWEGMELAENDIFDAPMGVYVGKTSTLPVMNGNKIHHCLDGVYMEGGGKGNFTKNTIEHCQYNGVYITDGADPHFLEGDVIQACGVAGIMVDAGGKGQFEKATIRRCVTGVIVYCGPSAPFHITYDEMVKANIVTSSPSFTENTIEENETHGVLVLSVMNGCPLRPTREEQEKAAEDNPGYLPPTHYKGGLCNSTVAGHDRLFPYFSRNIINRNRLVGVFHDRFEHWDFSAIEHAHGGHGGPAVAVKNAYGGYEILLGTSQVLATKEHLKQRESKQISFIENTITGNPVGLTAGYGCHPFLSKNKINDNIFFGLWLRFGSSVTATGCEMKGNGLTGLYAAKGAKGFICRGSMMQNNGLCRGQTTPSKPRDFKNELFENPFTGATEVPQVMQLSPQEAIGCLACYKQMTELVAVHAFIVHEAVQLLSEMSSANSSGTSLATGAVPSTMGGVDSGHRVGGIGVENYIRYCSSDGGIGVWVENGSRVTVAENAIEDNANVGVLFSNGFLSHHRVLYNGFPTTAPKPTLAAKSSRSNAVSSNSTQLQRPPLASAEYGVLFTAQAMCAAGITATAQVVSATDANFESLLELSLSMRPPEVKDERRDSIHHAGVHENKIAKNKYGVILELYGALKTSKETARVNTHLEVESPFFEEDDTPSMVKLSSNDLAVMRSANKSVDYSIIVEGNKIYENEQCGVLCQHVVQVFCSPEVFQHRGGFSDAVMKSYEEVRGNLIYNKTCKAVKLPFHVDTMDDRAHNASVVKNIIYGNKKVQGEITSRYVLVTTDKTRTLLQFDTLNTNRTSTYSSHVLMFVPPFAAMLQRPSPCLCDWDANTIKDASVGVVVSGYVGSASAHFFRNTFENLSKNALLVDGHMSSCTIGAGNTFQKNEVSVRMRTFAPPKNAIAATGKRGSAVNDLRTRIFNNTFSTAIDCSIICENDGDEHMLLCYNAFTHHMQGALALMIDKPTSKAIVANNSFTDNYCPVVVTKLAGKEDAAAVVFHENVFMTNYIGMLVCDGACPTLTRNLFDSNIRAGLELTGAATNPNLQECVFRNHKRGDDASSGESRESSPENVSGTPRPGRSGNKEMSYPDGGKLILQRGSYAVELVLDNQFVLGPNNRQKLPAGIILAPLAEGRVNQCVFTKNDVGVDCARDAGLASISAANPTHFKTCIFHVNSIAGVLVRRQNMELSSSSKLTAEDEMAEGTLFESCFFTHNTSDDEVRGDVVGLRHGRAVFRGSTFFGSTHFKDGTLMQITECQFLPPEGDADKLAAIYLHDGADPVIDKCTLTSRAEGMWVLPGARGRADSNLFVKCTKPITIAPYATTMISKNRFLQTRDCAVVAYGGVFTENEVFASPVGIVLQSAHQFPGLNSIPMSLRKGETTPLCTRNIVTLCEADGFLVTGPATVESNIISRCKTGVNIMCPTSVSTPPLIKSNDLFDNGSGVAWDDNTVGTVQDNDVFDNKIFGVWILPKATGMLQGNRISSMLDLGALEIPSECRVKNIENTIRNQFSPAYERKTRGGRESEQAEKFNAVVNEVAQLSAVAQSISPENSNWLSLAQSLVDDLVSIATKGFGEEAPETAQTARYARSGPRQSIAEAVEESRASSPKGKLKRTALVRRPSTVADAARRRVSVRAPKPSLPVIIHVFSQAASHTVANAVGTAVARILGSHPFSEMHLKTAITTSTSQLLEHLTTTPEKEATVPYLTIVVFDTSQKSFSRLDHEAFARLRSACTLSPKDVAADPEVVRLAYVLLPEALARDTKTVTDKSDSGVSLSDLQKRCNASFTFNEDVKEVLSQLSAAIGRGTRKAPAPISAVATAAAAASSEQRVHVESPLVPVRSGGSDDSVESKGKRKGSIAARRPSGRPRKPMGRSRTGSVSSASSRGSTQGTSLSGEVKAMTRSRRRSSVSRK